MFDGNDDFDLEDDFLNDVFDIEKENVNTLQKTVEDSTLNLGLFVHEGPSPGQRFVFNPVNAAGQSSSSALFLHNALRKTEDVSPCSSKQSDYIKTVTRKPLTASVQSSKTKRQRKFPGPAGLLPDRQNASFSDPEDTLPVIDSESICDVPVNDLCSQGPCSGSVLQGEPWQQMVADLGLQPPGREVLDTLNIASVKRKGAARLLVGRKVPFLAAVLHHIDASSADPVVVLRDHTGEMHGTLHRDVWEQFAAELTVGSVLVLRNVGVLSTGISARRHYLNITANNLTTIYSSSQGEARISNLRPLTKTDLIKTIEDWQRMVSQATCNSPGYRSSIPQLFNSIQPLSSSPSCSLPSKPPDLPTNKLQNNAINIRNLAKAFNNNQHLVIAASPSCSYKSSPSNVNNKYKEMFDQQTSGKFVPNLVSNNPSKINQLPSSNSSKINRLSNSSNSNNKISQLPSNNASNTNQSKRTEFGNSDFKFSSNNNFVSNSVNCSFDQESVDMFLSGENIREKSQQYVNRPNNWTNNCKNDNRFNNNSGNLTVSGKSESFTFQPKKPRFSSNLTNSMGENSNLTTNVSVSNITICSGKVTEDEKSVVESVLDGLDEDSFSDDF